MLSVACYKWTRPGFRSQFAPGAVNTLASMVRRHYGGPHRFYCVTNETEGIDARSVECIPDGEHFADVRSPHGSWERYPSCYRRLWTFSHEAADVFGPRVVQLDLDCVITGRLDDLWDRSDEFVIWGDTQKRTPYNGSMFLLATGSRAHVWESFDPQSSPQAALQAGYHGSDQAWISCALGPGEAKWTSRDGVYSYRNEIARSGGRLPRDARIVFFHGQHDPWGPVAQQLRWVHEAYH